MKTAAFTPILYFLAFLFLAGSAPIESRGQAQKDELLETIAERKRQFLISRLNLTGAEQRRFFSLYDEFLLATLRINRERGEIAEALRREYNLGNDAPKMALLATELGLFEGRLAEMKSSFYRRFEDLLGKRRFAGLILAEVDFQREIERLRTEYHNRQNMRTGY